MSNGICLEKKMVVGEVSNVTHRVEGRVGPGTGRKFCPVCTHLNGSVRHDCKNCGHQFKIGSGVTNRLYVNNKELSLTMPANNVRAKSHIKNRIDEIYSQNGNGRNGVVTEIHTTKIATVKRVGRGKGKQTKLAALMAKYLELSGELNKVVAEIVHIQG